MRLQLGPIITGTALGLFAFAPPASATTIGFTGAYDVSNWTISVLGGSTGGVDTTGAPNSVELESDDFGDGANSNVDFTFVAFEQAWVSFSWAYQTFDDGGPFWDPFGFLLNGAFTILTNGAGANTQNGAGAFLVSPGDVFGFRINSDSLFGPAFATVRDFQVQPVPEPATLLLLGTGLAVAARKRFAKRS